MEPRTVSPVTGHGLFVPEAPGYGLASRVAPASLPVRTRGVSRGYLVSSMNLISVK